MAVSPAKHINARGVFFTVYHATGELVVTQGIIHTVFGSSMFLQSQPTTRWASIQVYLGAQTADQQDMPAILGQISVSSGDDSNLMTLDRSKKYCLMSLHKHKLLALGHGN
jgi:hypothetical protein